MKLNRKKMKFYGTILGTAMAVDYCHLKENQLNPYGNVPQQYEQQITQEQYRQLIESRPMEVEAQEILANYANAINYEEERQIDAMYEGKYLEISGTVGEIVDEDTIRLINENQDKWYSEWMGIECNFEDEAAIQKLNEIKEKDEIKLSGYFEKYDGLIVELNDCNIKGLER